MSARDLTAGLHPVFAEICAAHLAAPSVIARATVPEPEPDGCEDCWEIRAQYQNKGLCNRCRRQAQRDHEAGL